MVRYWNKFNEKFTVLSSASKELNRLNIEVDTIKNIFQDVMDDFEYDFIISCKYKNDGQYFIVELSMYKGYHHNYEKILHKDLDNMAEEGYIDEIRGRLFDINLSLTFTNVYKTEIYFIIEEKK